MSVSMNNDVMCVQLTSDFGAMNYFFKRVGNQWIKYKRQIA
jgi:hypothetical protein